MERQESATVIVVTRNRPLMVQRCLEHLREQTVPVDEIIVVDSSTGEDTQVVLDGFPEAKRLRIPDGQNNRPQAKNLGIAHASADIVAFLDDDSMVRKDWLGHLLEPYASSAVGGVGGRVLDDLEVARADPEDCRVGVLRRDGEQTANFVLNPGRIVEVDYVRGCNMSFRRETLRQIGGFDPRCIGSNVGEEPELCLRVKHAGWSIVFQPRAVVDHLAAPREDLTRGVDGMEPDQIEAWPVIWRAHNRSYLLFKNFGLNCGTARHMLVGRPLLYAKFLIEEPTWPRARAALLYVVGAWWGLADSVMVRLQSATGKARLA